MSNTLQFLLRWMSDTRPGHLRYERNSPFWRNINKALVVLWCLYLDHVWALATLFVGHSVNIFKQFMITEHIIKLGLKSFGSFTNLIKPWPLHKKLKVNILYLKLPSVCILGKWPWVGSESTPSWYGLLDNCPWRLHLAFLLKRVPGSTMAL